MDKTRQYLDGIMSDQTQGNALSVVGLSHLDSSNDLLEDALSGGMKSPAAHPSTLPDLDPSRKSQDFSELNNTMKQALRGEQEDLPDASGGSLGTEPDASAQRPEDKVSPEFHSLNKELQESRKQFEDYTRQQNEQRRQEQQQMQQWLAYQQQQQMQAQQANQPTFEDHLANEWGVDPQALRQYTQHVAQQASAHQQQLINQQIMPLILQQQEHRFDAEYARAKEMHGEKFGEYFSKDQMLNMYRGLVQKYGPNYVAQVNWQKEFGNAFASKDYARLQAEYNKLTEQSKKVEDKKESHKQQQKANLKLVPKANAQGASSTPSLSKDLDNLPSNLSFKQFGKEMLRLRNR